MEFFIAVAAFLLIVAMTVFLSKKKPSPKKATAYKPKKLMNASEANTFKTITKYINSNKKTQNKYHVFSQVSMGEFIRSTDKSLFFKINAKRVDFLITDKNYHPFLVLEVNGSGHYIGKDTKERDRVKKKAVEDAGIYFRAIEIKKPAQAEAATNRVLKAINW